MSLRLWIAFSLPAIAAVPLLRRAFPNLRDGGASVARPAAWLLVSWLAWFVSSIPGVAIYGTPLVAFATVALAAAGGLVAWQDRAIWRELLKKEWKTIALGEAIGLGVFALGVWLVAWNGDVHPLAERFMDYAIIQRIGLSTSFPPQDSWLSGLTLQYYYYGYVVMDVLRRIAGMTLRDFFNPAIAGVYATFAIALFGAGMAVSRGSRGAGIVAAIAGAAVSNYDLARQLVVKRMQYGEWKFLGMDWFHTSRVIDGTINETPAFAAFWGDLHPYLIAFPFVVLCLTLAVASLSAETHPIAGDRPWRDRVLALVLLVIPLGALFPTNSWDFPTFLGLAMLALAWPLIDWDALFRLWTSAFPRTEDGAATRTALVPIGLAAACSLVALVVAFVVRSFVGSKALVIALPLPVLTIWLGRESAHPIVRSAARTVERVAIVSGTVALLSVLAYVFFHIGFGKQVDRGIRLAQRRSDVIPMLTHFGPWFLAIVFWAAATAKDRGLVLRRLLPLPLTALALAAFEQWGGPAVEGLVKSLAASGPLFLAQGIDHLFLRGLAFGVCIAALWVLLADLEGPGIRTPEGMSRILMAAAFFVVLVCEFAYVDDFYGGKNERMNTVFKAYIQAWILLGIGCAGVLAAGWRALPGSLFRGGVERGFVFVALFMLTLLALASRTGPLASGGGRVTLLLAAPVVFLVYRHLRERTLVPKAVYACGIALALVPGLAFTALADYNRSSGWRNTRSGNEATLDPLDLFREQFPADYQAALWIEKNLDPDAVVLEASAHAYEWESRFATFSGRPTLVGWKNHESGWRNDWTIPTERGKIVDAIYGATDLETAWKLCRENGIDYVAMGELERNRAALPVDLPKEEVTRRLGPPRSIQSGSGMLFGRTFGEWQRWNYGEVNVWVGDGKVLRTDQKKEESIYHPETFLGAEAAYSSDRVAIYKVPPAAPNQPVMSKN